MSKDRGSLHMPERKGDWIQTYSGVKFYPLDPRPDEIKFKDIAWSLSMQTRYNGHASMFYSVAEHCVHVSSVVAPEHALAALMHDSSEAYATDLPYPLKPYIQGYAALEDGLMRCIADLYRFQYPLADEIKDIDRRICINEKEALFEHQLEWNIPGGRVHDVGIQGWSQKKAFEEFTNRFFDLI